MNKKDKLKSLLTLYDNNKFNQITSISFCKDGRILIFHGDCITQIPLWKLEQGGENND